MRSGAGGAEANGSKICPACAESVKADALVCRYCRYDFSGTVAVQPVSSGTASAPTLNALAVASLVLGILWIWFVGSLLAVIFGYVSRRQIRRSRGRQRGEGLATAGIVLGWIAMVALAVVVGLGVVEGAAFSFWHHAEVSQRDTAIADVRRLRDAMNAYYAKHHSYPDSSAGPQELVADGEIAAWPNDPWGRPYLYLNEDGKPLIVTFGRDGQQGGDGLDEDISTQDLPFGAEN